MGTFRMPLMTVFASAIILGLSGGCAPTEATTEPVETSAPVAVHTEPSASVGETSVVQTAIQTSSDADRYLFVFVSAEDSPDTQALRGAFETAMGEVTGQADATFINRDSGTERPFVDEYALAHAPMPLVLAMAPSGVITGSSYGEELKQLKLQELIAGPAEQQVLKILQEQNLVLLCLQNETTKSNESAMKGVEEFKKDERFASFTEVVKVDPAAEANRQFLEKLQVDPEMQEATTLFLAPPSRLLTKIEGATTKDALFAALTAGSGGSCCSAR